MDVRTALTREVLVDVVFEDRLDAQLGSRARSLGEAVEPKDLARVRVAAQIEAGRDAA